MNGAHQFVARNYTVQFMLMTAYNLLPREITGGPTWIDSDAYDIVGTTPGGVRPKRSDEIVIRYDFDLEWTPDETQFEGRMRSILKEKSGKPDLFEAMQQQLGLKLESAKGPVEVFVIDHVERPSEN